MSAIDNVALGGGYARGKLGSIDWGEQRRLTQTALERFGVSLQELDAPLSQVAPVERTAVAIVRALAGWEESSGVLVLDEPTAALPASEVDRLHAIVRDVAHGKMLEFDQIICGLNKTRVGLNRRVRALLGRGDIAHAAQRCGRLCKSRGGGPHERVHTCRVPCRSAVHLNQTHRISSIFDRLFG